MLPPGTKPYAATTLRPTRARQDPPTARRVWAWPTSPWPRTGFEVVPHAAWAQIGDALFPAAIANLRGATQTGSQSSDMWAAGLSH